MVKQKANVDTLAELLADAGPVARVHLLDVGPEEYGDALLCQFGDDTVLIDGAHPGNNRLEDGHQPIQEQIARILGVQLPVKVSLLIVTHCHDDHIGCLPALVKSGDLSAEFALVSDPDLGWGRAIDAAPPRLDARVAAVLAGLREEPRSPAASDAELEAFLADAANLEDRYRTMVDALAKKGTVVRYGQKGAYKELQKRFQHLQLEIVGPSQDQLLITADLIAKKTTDNIDRISEAMRGDATASAADVYRQLIAVDALDVSRPGAAINLQSIVTRFTVGGKRFLFGGDMQFTAPGVSDARIAKSMRALRDGIASSAPYAFVKLSHHGSNNGFDEDFLGELGSTKYFGICAGSGSTAHPNPETLQILNDHSNQITWVRTDHNGLSTLTFGAKTTIHISEGHKNDPRPNVADVPVTTASSSVTVLEPAQSAEGARTPIVVSRSSGGEDVIELIARIPNRRTRVTFTVAVEPDDGGGLPAGRLASSASGNDWRVASNVDRLLFVTNGPAFQRNIGSAEAAHVLSALRNQRATIVDIAGASRPTDAVRRQVENVDPRGVVILGGYDVVPAQRLDCLPPRLRAGIGNTDDPDNFIVWSDDVYGDRDGDGLPELPVSRIPDGRTSSVVFGALGASDAANPQSRAGVHNVERPFARTVYQPLPGSEPIRQSAPTIFNRPSYQLDGHHVYLMLHGDYTDSSRFWGEGTQDNAEAVNLTNVPKRSPSVVFTGCCWGALTVDKPAGRYAAGQSMGIKAANTSIALTFLERGARAFIGCTGAHYSPTQPPYDYFGGPMHSAFWQLYRSGKPPARALYDAKVAYLQKMPHGQRTTVGQSIEFKILRQYTCLGLGW